MKRYGYCCHQHGILWVLLTHSSLRLPQIYFHKNNGKSRVRACRLNAALKNVVVVFLHCLYGGILRKPFRFSFFDLTAQKFLKAKKLHNRVFWTLLLTRLGRPANSTFPCPSERKNYFVLLHDEFSKKFIHTTSV